MMATATSWVGLRLDPLDTLFFRDGRPFDAATRASGGLPQPQTLAGALRTALLARTGFDFAAFARKRKNADVMTALRDGQPAECAPIFKACFRGPWLALATSDNAVSPLLPMPETLKRAKAGGWSVATPVKSVPGWSDPLLKPLWRTPQPDPKAEAEFIPLPILTRFLRNGDLPTEIESRRELFTREALFGFDHRVGIEVDKDTLTSADGMLYVISLLATKRKILLDKRRRKDEAGYEQEEREKRTVCLYAEVGGNVATHFSTPLVVPFGGEGKYVQVTKTTAPAFTTPTATTGPAFWYLATPTFFPPTGRPLPKPPSAKLIAAASGAGVPISGWDVARNGPRATRFAVPAGAVYFVEGDCRADDFLNTGNANESNDLRQEGWGFALSGTWGGLT